MTEGNESQIARLREAVYDLEKRVVQAPEQARDLVDATLGGGIEYVIFAVLRLRDDLEHATRRVEVPERMR